MPGNVSIIYLVEENLKTIHIIYFLTSSNIRLVWDYSRFFNWSVKEKENCSNNLASDNWKRITKNVNTHKSSPLDSKGYKITIALMVIVSRSVTDSDWRFHKDNSMMVQSIVHINLNSFRKYPHFQWHVLNE